VSSQDRWGQLVAWVDKRLQHFREDTLGVLSNTLSRRSTFLQNVDASNIGSKRRGRSKGLSKCDGVQCSVLGDEET
jgi:hypothetical protein